MKMKRRILSRIVVWCAITLPVQAGDESGSSVKERFWLKDPADLHKVLKSHLALNPTRGEIKEIGKSFSGRPVYAVRYGSGPQTIVFVNAHHGWEVVTTNGANAFMWTLFSG